MDLLEYLNSPEGGALIVGILFFLVLLIKKAQKKKIKEDEYQHIVYNIYSGLSTISIAAFILSGGKNFIFGNQVKDLYIPLIIIIITMLRSSYKNLQKIGR